ncbi:MAG: sensor histidine kinase [Thermoanaerobaculaceae bacterium]
MVAPPAPAHPSGFEALREGLWRLAHAGTRRQHFPAALERLLQEGGVCTSTSFLAPSPRLAAAMASRLAADPVSPSPLPVTLPLRFGDQSLGALRLEGVASEWRDPEALVRLAEEVATCLAYERAQWALGERVKELSCLYAIAQILDHGGGLDETLFTVARLLPFAWQHPDATVARVLLDGRTLGPASPAEPFAIQAAPILVDGVERGRVEVATLVSLPAADEGPFLREERNLLDEVARQISQLVHRRAAEEERARLAEQLRQSERLASVGQLAAGVAHELNEPLGAILGYGQLLQKTAQLPEQPQEDLERIVKACLHAREIVRNLLLFARQVPPRLAPTDLNAVVREVLHFMHGPCERAGVVVTSEPCPGLPTVHADGAQLRQVLVNLVANAVQSMPTGGRLGVRTEVDGPEVVLAVEDTGTGMSEEVRARIFDPFFTTKEVGQGTGLGLAVAHGIVVAHGGRIGVSSRRGRGSRFEVRLPTRTDGPGAW